ncbi:MAG: hypothetical protein ABIM44_02970 [candidate division WOR-3 bacterium]
MVSSEKIILKAGIYALLVYSLISIVSYFALYFRKIGNFTGSLNSGIDILLFIPLYVTIVVLYFSYIRVTNKNDQHGKTL